MDCLIAASFDGARFGLYTTAFGATASKPSLGISRAPGGMTLDWGGEGKLQESSNLSSWADLSAAPPFSVRFNESPGKYYRVVER
jgi:hypothetical protein